MKKNKLESDLEHSRAAYRFAVNGLPLPDSLKSGTIRANGFEFARESQIESMKIEYGWAFFCRYEACVERFIRNKGVHLSKRLSLLDWLDKNNIKFPGNYRIGMDAYRKIRNSLHHSDGASLSGEPDTEIHLYPEQMENFFKLFVWIGSAVENLNHGSRDVGFVPSSTSMT